MTLRDLLEQDITEIKMAPGSLSAQALKMRPSLGFEMEMYIDPDEINVGAEPDMDQDERLFSEDDIERFFYGDRNGSYDVRRLMRSINSDYADWKSRLIDSEWDSDVNDYFRKWLATSEIAAEYGDDEEGLEKYIDQAITNQSADYQAAYDQYVRDKEFDDEYSFETFLRDEDLDWGIRIYERYSSEIDWPYYKSNSVYEELADRVESITGSEARWSNRYHGVSRSAGDYYIVEPDTSLKNPNNSSDEGVEIISPPLPYEKAVRDFAKIHNWAKRFSAYTNETTGLHINISFPYFDPRNIDYVKLVILSGDEYVLKQFGREFNLYAENMTSKLREKAVDLQGSTRLDDLSKEMRRRFNETSFTYLHSGNTEHGDSVNVRDNRVEFRSPGNNWLDKSAEQLLAVVNRYTVALSAAMDPGAYRQEYLKKLYKLINPGNDPARSLFARVLAGDIDRQQFRFELAKIIQKRELPQQRTKPQPAATPEPESKIRPPQRGEYRWKIVDDTGRLLHRFVSSMANRDNEVRAWAQRTGVSDLNNAQIVMDFSGV